MWVVDSLETLGWESLCNNRELPRSHLRSSTKGRLNPCCILGVFLCFSFPANVRIVSPLGSLRAATTLLPPIAVFVARTTSTEVLRARSSDWPGALITTSRVRRSGTTILGPSPPPLPRRPPPATSAHVLFLG